MASARGMPAASARCDRPDPRPARDDLNDLRLQPPRSNAVDQVLERGSLARDAHRQTNWRINDRRISRRVAHVAKSPGKQDRHFVDDEACPEEFKSGRWEEWKASRDLHFVVGNRIKQPIERQLEPRQDCPAVESIIRIVRTRI